MKIAFIGQKGIPATFGGVEYHVEELAARLAQRGHDVTVYVRDWYTPREMTTYKGIKLIHTPTIQTKHLDAFLHCLTSTVHSLFAGYDIIHYHSVGPSFFSWIPRIIGVPTISTIHRFDYEAAKWGRFAKWFLKQCEKIALVAPVSTIVVAKHQKAFYEQQGYKVQCIPNGVPLPELCSPKRIKDQFGLNCRDYILFLGRLVPEKRVHWLIEAYKNLNTQSVKLVIAGGSSATDEYVKYLHDLAGNDPNIIFTGYVTGDVKEEIFSNAKVFVIPSELEGLPIALLEAMSYGLVCLASSIPPHKEIITDGENGHLFDADSKDDLQIILGRLLELDQENSRIVGQKARELVASEYNWDNVVDQIEKLYREVLEK